MRRVAIGVAMIALLAPAAPAIAAPAAGHPILASGMRDNAVKRVQKKLGVAPTGFFGPTTLAAVQKYQRKHGIPVTGVVGPKTWAALTAAKAKKPARKPAKKKHAKRTANPLTASTLQYGDRGDAVLYLQQQLGVQPQTSYFGPITQAYVKALQAAAKIPVTGVVDQRTWRKVGKVKFTPPAAPPPASTTTTTSPTNATAAEVLRIAKSLAGIPYVANGYSPEQGFNCSSYTQWVYKQVGIDLGGAYTVWQYDKSKHISASQALPGDLVFFYNYKDDFIGHVGIYAGNGMIWHAPRTGRVVSLEKIWTDKVYYGRVLNQ